MSMKSSRNKTIDFSIEQGKKYLARTVSAEKSKEIPLNSTVLGDAYLALSKVKDKSVDLLIVDPPYNLDKNFHGNGFKKRGLTEYAEYTEKWREAVKPKLKDSASVYVCCDWKRSLVIGYLIDKHFNLRNRITWQREKGRGAKSNWKNSMAYGHLIWKH